MSVTVLHGDCRETLKQIPAGSVQCCVTSPPYYGLRRYLRKDHPDAAREIGQEKTPELFVETLVSVFREVKRCLHATGTCWLNIGDSYAGSGRGMPGHNAIGNQLERQGFNGDDDPHGARKNKTDAPPGHKAKDLCLIPFMLAIALKRDGWYVRSDIIWHKANCMPESVTDRPTRAHEYIFLLSKQARYYYNHEAIKEPCIYDVDGTGTAARKARQNVDDKSMPTAERNGMRPGGYKNSVNFKGKNEGKDKQRGHSRRHAGFNDRWDDMEKAEQCTGMRNKRDVWSVAPANYPDAHFATYPPDLIKPCILAGSRARDTILDPFGGSGTTGEVATEFGREAILCELNDEYLPLIHKRTNVTKGLALA